MPKKLNHAIQQLQRSFEQSMQLFQETIDELASAGQLREGQKAAILGRYRRQMMEQAPFLELDEEGGLAVASAWKQELQEHTDDIEWRLQLYGEDTSIDASVHAMSAYLHRQREDIQAEVNRAFERAQRLFEESAPLVVGHTGGA